MLFVALILVGIGIVRVITPNFDHALANLLTIGLSFLAWLVATVGCLASSGLRSIGIGLGFGPPLALGGFLALNKFERFDAEMLPHFSSRWAKTTELRDKLPAEELKAADGIFDSKESDYPQFLGPNRDAKVAFDIAEDWKRRPPEIIWKQPIGEGWSGFAIQGDAAITMEQRDDSEWVSAYSVADGSLLWKHSINALHSTVPGGTGPRSTPLIAANRVYACSAVDRFVCLDLATGQEIWSQNLLELASVSQEEFEKNVAWGRSASPLIVGRLVLVPFGGPKERPQTLIAFDAETGEERWRSGEGQAGYSSPVQMTLGGKLQVLLVSEKKVASFDPATGKELWQSEWPGVSNADPAVAHPVQVNDSQILLGKGYGEGSQLLEVRQDGGGWIVNEIWRSRRTMKTKFNTAVVLDGYAYGLSDGILECIDVSNGERVWKRGRYRHGQTLLLNDKLLVLTESGKLVLVEATPSEHEELAEFEVIGDVSWNTMALSGDRLLIRNSTEAACVRLPSTSTATEQSQPLASATTPSSSSAQPSDSDNSAGKTEDATADE